MASPLRLSDALVRRAEAAGRLHKRSLPKQIEYWAELGLRIERAMDPTDVVALCQGLARVAVTPVASAAVDPAEVFGALSADRERGRLTGAVTRANVYYEASATHPGLLDRVHAGGRREAGRFREGEFEPVTGSP